jgi:hypothetical protein
VTFNPSSRSLLTPRDLPQFPSDSQFDRIARALCSASALPRKELYESWAVAQLVAEKFQGGAVFDLACGHGLIAQLMLLLDDTAPRALAVDARIPESASKVFAALCATWPQLADRVEFLEGPIARIQGQPAPRDLVISAHACGPLTDEVLALAADAQCRVAVLPCCHDKDSNDDAGLTGWLDRPLAIDAVRAVELRDRGYAVDTLRISDAITPKNRLLLGTPIFELYQATSYEAYLPEKVTLRPGQRSPLVDALLRDDAPEWAFITAWNPGSRQLARAENERRQKALIAELSGRYRLYPGAGLGDAGDWSPELSTLVLGLPQAQAIARGRAWGQFAVLCGKKGEPARVVDCRLSHLSKATSARLPAA